LSSLHVATLTLPYSNQLFNDDKINIPYAVF